MEKWQRRLIAGKDFEGLGQSGTSVPVDAPEGKGATLAHTDETAQLTKDVATAYQLGDDYNGDGGTTDASRGARTTPWGIPIPEGWDPADPVFQRHPAECDCYRHGVLRCGVPCIWAWVPGAQPGDKAWRIKDV
jgi:hypothetical protein